MIARLSRDSLIDAEDDNEEEARNVEENVETCARENELRRS